MGAGHGVEGGEGVVVVGVQVLHPEIDGVALGVSVHPEVDRVIDQGLPDRLRRHHAAACRCTIFLV